MSLWPEIGRRKLVQVAGVYAVVAWLLVQIVATVEAPLRLPDWADTLVIVLLLVGFPVALIMSWTFNVTADGLVRDDGLHEPYRDKSRTLEYALIGLLVVAVGWVVYRVEVGPRADATPSARSANVLPNSIAVLLCDSFSTDSENDFFAASLHEELLNHLVQLRSLNVIARTSVLQYAGAVRPITEIADELRVASVMECSVAYGDGRIVISAQLIDGDTGLHLWSERYNREFADVFGIQADIAMNVANALQAEFSLEEQQAIEQAPTSSPAAYALYLEARSLVDIAAPGSIDEAHRLLDRALAIDPGFASAYGLKADLFGATFVNTAAGTGVAPDERDALERRVRELAATALELDPSNTDARRALRSINIPTWRWSAFLASIAPRDETTLINTELWVYAWTGRPDECIRLGERIVALSPNDVDALWSQGVCYAYAGDRAASTRQFRRSLEQLPANPLIQTWIAYNEVALGRTEAAAAALALVEQLLGDERPTVYLPELAYSYARIGRLDEARRLVEELRSRGGPDTLGAGTWAVAYLAVGDEQSALEQLEAVARKARNHEPDQGYLNVMNLKMNYLADPRLEQPEFVDVLNRIRGD